jgi:Reverse transcriptase (RNA-dependent DNA polymerase)
MGDTKFEEIVTYNRMLQWVEQDQDKDDFFRLVGIEDHKKILGKWCVLVRWASGETTWNHLATIKKDDPVTVAMYAKRNGLLDEDGWGGLKKLLKNTKMLGRMVNQTRLKSFRNKPVYKYGAQVPRSHAEAIRIDEKNGNTNWQDAEKLEVSQLMDYQAFESLGIGAPTPKGYKKIPCHFVYDRKVTGICKARLVAGGHRTDTPIDSVYSGVVSLQGVRIVTFLAELNDLELWGTDVGNAYLESYTKEKVVFVAGPEFGAYEGHTMII